MLPPVRNPDVTRMWDKMSMGSVGELRLHSRAAQASRAHRVQGRQAASRCPRVPEPPPGAQGGSTEDRDSPTTRPGDAVTLPPSRTSGKPGPVTSHTDQAPDCRAVGPAVGVGLDGEQAGSPWTPAAGPEIETGPAGGPWEAGFLSRRWPLWPGTSALCCGFPGQMC